MMTSSLAADALSRFLSQHLSARPDDDDYIRESAAAFGEITALLKANLTDIKVFKVGPKDDQGKLAVDQGLYAQVVVGRTADGKIAAIVIGDAET